MLNIYTTSASGIRGASGLFLGAALLVLLGASLAPAAVLDPFGPPPAGDPSVLTGPQIGSPFVDINLAALPEANAGSFQGGPTGTKADTAVNSVIPQAQLQINGAIDVPTNSRPSPLFGAQPFTQQLLLFEEFGPENIAIEIGSTAQSCKGGCSSATQTKPGEFNEQAFPALARSDEDGGGERSAFPCHDVSPGLP